MDNFQIFMIIMIFIGFCIFVFVIRESKIIEFPTLIYQLDISGRRNVDYDTIVDEFLIENYDTIEQEINNSIDVWSTHYESVINNSIMFKNFAKKNYNNFKNDVTCGVSSVLQLRVYRLRTAYKQVNYQKIPYQKKVVDAYCLTLNDVLNDVLNAKRDMERTNFELTRKQFDSKNQRSLMTKELRHEIEVRDNYTCQICGKYMPDRVGLHIDHITPVSKGGKSVPRNLRVLCDKCNLSKGDKI